MSLWKESIENVESLLSDDNLSTTQGSSSASSSSSSSSGSSVGSSTTSSSSTDNNRSPNHKKRRNRRKKRQQGSNSSHHHHHANSNSNNKRVSKATSTKPHDAPMKKGDIYFALDCEMVGVGPDGIDSALARVCIVNWDNKVVLDTFVQVAVPVTDYRTFVSGVLPKDIQSECGAMPLRDVRTIVQSIINGKVLIGHGLENDLKALGITHPWTDIRDTATYTPFMKKHHPSSSSSDESQQSQQQQQQQKKQQPMLLPRRLKELASELLNQEIQVMGKSHCPIEDAKASMALYKHVRNDWETHNRNQIHQSSQLYTAAMHIMTSYNTNNNCTTARPSYPNTTSMLLPSPSPPPSPIVSSYYHHYHPHPYASAKNNNNNNNWNGHSFHRGVVTTTTPRTMQV